jgi:hypothetical protein
MAGAMRGVAAAAASPVVIPAGQGELF